MADAIATKNITQLTAQTSIGSAYLIPVSTGTAQLYKITWGNITGFDFKTDSTFNSTWEALLK